MVAKYAIEKWAKIPVDVEIASEFRYRDPIIDSSTLIIAISQSGETMDTLMAVRHAKAAGADAALVVCPYYNKPNQAGLYAHFKAINDAVALPVFLYNVPGRTIIDLLPQTVAALAALPNIIGIKDASDEMERVALHQHLIGPDEQFIQLSGEDSSALGHRAMGGAGCISVTANVLPEACAAMHAAFDDGDLETARAINQRLVLLHRAMFSSPSPGPAKYALSRMGLCTDEVRLPITPPDAEARAQIDAALHHAGVNI
jgi:4-hydroxy-tetrahydrodipicolinate synthase